MLLGRTQERLAIDRLLAEARQGHSGCLAFVGEPGIGKTVLLEYALGEAAEMRLMRARGVESEAEIAFAGLAELLSPALGAIERIPPPQAAALEGALTLGPALAQDRFAVGAATLSLLSSWAEDGPGLLLIDDAHLLDSASADALRFAIRRLVADPIAVILTAREGEPSLLDGADLRVLRLAGLERSDATLLLHGLEVRGESVERLYRATGGNPLALIELAPAAERLLTAPGDAPIPISTTIAEAFVRRIEALGEATRRTLLVAAASDSREISVIAAAAARCGLSVEDLAAAEDAGLLTLGQGELEFSHPMARSAVYGAATGRERREAHAALAATLPDGEVERRAWHLAAASIGPDAEASLALGQAGERARQRSAYTVAAAAFERGGQLATSEELRARMLFAAADAAWLGGDGDRTLRLLEQARDHAVDPGLAARIEQLHGHVLMRRGPVMEGYRLIVSAAEQSASSEPELAVVMLAEAVHGCFYAGDTEAMRAAAARAGELADGQDSGRASFFAAMAGCMALVADGRGEEGAAEARRAVSILEREDELRDDPRLLAWAAFGPLWLREKDADRGLIDRALERARATSAVGILPTLLHNVARHQATSDQWPAAEACYDEAVRLARETGQRTEIAASLAGLSWLEARQGRERACREHAEEAAMLCSELGMGLYGVWAIAALAELELALARPEAALAHLEAQARALRGQGIDDVDLAPGPELVDTYLRLGRPEEAAAATAEFTAAAQAKGQPWALARAERCRGMLAESSEFEQCFEQAVLLHERTPDDFETARTRLSFGARLRRERKRVRSREELRAALDAFEGLGAWPWAEQARGELQATGETARRRDTSTLDDLTPQERQIARLLADGRTTREAAASMFLSPKTVEYHLGHVYRKLGIRSREQLAAAFSEDGEPGS